MAKLRRQQVQVMRGKRVVVTLAILFLAILFAAWFDGGEEPLRPMEHKVPVPAGAAGGQV